MDGFVKAFLKASLAWLAMGVTLGVGMAAHPAWLIYRPAHVHMNLLGFVTMMIYGVAYHVIPRFTGHLLHSRHAAVCQWWVSNVGLALMVTGFITRANGFAPSTVMLATGGVLAALGPYGFVFNIWRTIDGRAAPRTIVARAMAAPAGDPLQRTAPRSLAEGGLAQSSRIRESGR